MKKDNGIDIIIDRLTDCLIERKTGKEIETEYKLRSEPFKKKDSKGWRFDWIDEQKNDRLIYELFLKGDTEVQGRISMTPEDDHIEVIAVETAPHNYSSKGKYEGVGAHLFAIACKVSEDYGYEGCIAFEAKTNLVEYYRNKLNATPISDRRLAIFENAAEILIRKYIK